MSPMKGRLRATGRECSRYAYNLHISTNQFCARLCQSYHTSHCNIDLLAQLPVLKKDFLTDSRKTWMELRVCLFFKSGEDWQVSEEGGQGRGVTGCHFFSFCPFLNKNIKTESSISVPCLVTSSASSGSFMCCGRNNFDLKTSQPEQFDKEPVSSIILRHCLHICKPEREEFWSAWSTLTCIGCLFVFYFEPK